MLTVDYKGTEYALSTSLRVAYKFQGMNNHTPYGKLLTTLGEKTLEDQISLIYCSLISANPSVVTIISQKDFLNYILDTYQIVDIMRIDSEIIKGIYGGKETDVETNNGDTQGDNSTEDETFLGTSNGE